MKRRLLALGLLVALAVFLFWWFWPQADLTPPIEAAWREVVPTNIQVRMISANREKLDSFIDLLECRINVEVPKWWRDALMDAQWGQGGYFFAPQVKGFENKNTGKQYKLPFGTTLETEVDKLIFSIGEHSKKRSDDIEGSLPDGVGSLVRFDCVSALLTPQHSFICVHRNSAGNFPLYCMDMSTGKLLWRRIIEWRGVDGSLVNPHVWVSIIENDKQVFVFCLGTHDGLHVEGCRKSDGKSALSFSSDWWGESFKNFGRGR